MVEYRIRTPFRIAAWFPGLVCIAMSTGLVVVGYRSQAAGELSGLLTILLGLLILAPAFFFVRIGWTGRVPAFAEEYGLDAVLRTAAERFPALRSALNVVSDRLLFPSFAH